MLEKNYPVPIEFSPVDGDHENVLLFMVDKMKEEGYCLVLEAARTNYTSILFFDKKKKIS